jgi:tetratricopeptide (TPR) repeat protein
MPYVSAMPKTVGSARKPSHRHSLELNRQVGHRDGEITDLGNLGVVLRDRGRLNEAFVMQNEAIALADQFNLVDSMWRIRLGRAETHRLMGSPEAAQEDWQKAIQVIEQSRERLGLETQRMSFLGEDKMSVYTRLVLFLLRERAQRTNAFEYVERAKTRVMIDQLAVTPLRMPAGLSAALVEQERELLRQSRALLAAPAITPEGVEHFRTITSALSHLWDEIEHIAPEYAASRRARPLTYPDLRGLLR